MMPARTRSQKLRGGGKHRSGRRHQESAGDQHPPPAEPVGASGEEQRHDGVADERQRQDQADLRFGEADADQIEDQDYRQRAIREQPDEPRREQQPAIAVQMGEGVRNAQAGAGHASTLTQKSGSPPGDADNIDLVRVLIVEDERKLRDVLATALQSEHYDVVASATGDEGFVRAQGDAFDLVVLDLMLPGRSGLEILQALRQRRIDTPVLVLTARDGVDDRVFGLDLGADDYLVKPFALPELLARIRALLRRGRPAEAVRLKTADLEIDLVARRASRGSRSLDLTVREFDLLEYLLRHQGHLVSREMLAREVWKEPRRATPIDNVIDVQMTRLRRKVDVDGGPRLIHTVRGVGFVLREGEP
jgi:DNA-binding response OmpR family regulator